MKPEFSFKELYDVFIKTKEPITIGQKTYQKGETVCLFDKIQISNFNEVREYATAHGGIGDLDRVVWDRTQELELLMTQGIFNELQFAVICNSNIVYHDTAAALCISKREELESDENCVITLKETPHDLHVYDKATSEKIIPVSVEENLVTIDVPYRDVIVDYYYNYTNKFTQVKIGERLNQGFYRIEGKTRVKDDVTGNTRTGFIVIPNARIVSKVSMKLGTNASPVVGTIQVRAFPTKELPIMEMYFLSDDIDSDL